ncbi:hypothetical protein SSX86_017713 [Deinandra increscens subsp. villosa]|uniref:Integrase catalytic domain-containing protein n=1 Tax=Deinandra increscens subsp. villosa TaxID=3103831 RepID=A0AAP0GVY2_9ASTR
MDTGFHHQRTYGLNLPEISFQSSPRDNKSEMIVMGQGLHRMNSTGSLNFSGISGVVNGGSTFTGIGNSGDSLVVDSVPELKNRTGLAVEWSVEEQYKLEEALPKYADETGIIRYVKIAATLRNKTVRDVALRCRWMGRKRRKHEELNLWKTTKDKKEKSMESSSKLSVQSYATPNVAPFSVSTNHRPRNDGLHVETLRGSIRNLLEQNSQVLGRISSNICALRSLVPSSVSVPAAQFQSLKSDPSSCSFLKSCSDPEGDNVKNVNTTTNAFDVLSMAPRLTDNKLNGSNFFEWSKTIRIYLRSIGKDSHLESDPPTDTTKTLWMQTDAKLFLQIRNAIDVSVLSLINHCEYVKELMGYLDFLYSGQSNISRIYTICKTFHRGEQVDRSLTSYVMEFKKTYEELNSLLPLSADVKVMQTQREQIAVMSFLTGLRPEFDNIRSQLLNESKIPTLQETFARILRNESTPAHISTASNSALVSRGGFRGNFRGGSRGGHRGNYRNTSGYHSPAQNAPTTDQSNMECYYCHELGHTKYNCKQPGARYSKGSHAHAATTSDNNTQPTATLVETGTPAQCLVSSTSKWVIDSGASEHMTGNSQLLSNFCNQAPSSHVTIADGSTPKVMGSGSATITPSIHLSSVLNLPNFPFNLLSVSKLTRGLNCSALFYPNFCVLQDLSTKKIIGRGKESDGLYILEAQTPYSLACPSSSPFETHCRLGHPSLQSLKKLCPEFSSLSSLQCESCQFAKHQRVHLSPRINKRATSPFELIHSDVWGPCPVVSKSGFKYFVLFVDDYSRVTWLYLMKSRSEVFTHFCSFYSEIKTQFNVSVKTLRSDNAKEYLSESFQTHFLKNGILHESSCVDTPAQNGVAERKNRHLLEVARALLFQTKMPKTYWADAVSTACFLINRMPSVILNHDIPYSVLFPTKPVFPIAPKIFGSTCFVRDTRPQLSKLDPKSLKCVFVGYCRLQKGYRCYSPTLQKYIVSRDVTFHENVPFFETVVTPQPDPSEEYLQYSFEEYLHPPPVPNPLPEPIPPQVPGPAAPDQSPVIRVYERRNRLPSDSAPEPILTSTDQPNNPPDSDSDSDLPIAMRKGKRACTHPIASFVSYDKLTAASRSFVANLDSITIPKTLGEALAHNGWRKAMIEEMEALDQNNTWNLVNLPINKKAIGCKWVFTVKVNPDGSLARLKARLVAKGYAQVYGMDYSETFSPVAKMSSVRLFISLAATYNWDLYQLDIKNAFLHGDLQEEVYIEQPPGFVAQGESGKVCRLKKSLYGLKQSPRAWFGKFNKVVTEFGLRRSSYDHSVFFASSAAGCILLVVYVDDIVITGSDRDGIQKLKSFLGNKFQTKDLGTLKYFLGIEVSRNRKGIYLSQRKYCLDVLRDSKMIETKNCDAPMIPNGRLGAHEGDPLADAEKYRRIVGKLNYLTITRPDIAFPVSVVSQFMSSPRTSHWEAVCHILKYLKGAPGRGILYQNNGHHTVEGFTDADYNGDPTSRRSTTGYCIRVGGNLVSWKSKKQSVVSRSSAESEYRAMAQTTCELVWVRNLLGEIGFKQNKPMNLWCDNEAAIHIANNPVFHERTKHIEVDCHFTREKLEDGTIATPHLQDNVDLFRQMKNNITAILNDMRCMPGPPLPVTLNEDLVNSIISVKSQTMMFPSSGGMSMKQEPGCW